MIRNWMMFLCLVAALGALILEVEGSPYKEPISSPRPDSSEADLQTQSQEQPVCEPTVETRMFDCFRDTYNLIVDDEVEKKLNCQTRIPDAIASYEEMYEKDKVCLNNLTRPIYRAQIVILKSNYRAACLTISEQQKTQAEFNSEFFNEPDTMKALFGILLYQRMNKSKDQ